MGQVRPDFLSSLFYSNYHILFLCRIGDEAMKTCKLCGKLFEPKSNAQQICTDVHYRSCEVCGNSFVIKRPSSSQLCCSKKCTEIKRQRTMIERHGVPHALQNTT